MKHLKVAILALLLVVGFSNANAQDKNNPWALGIGVNAVDFYPTNPGIPGHGSWFNEFFNAKDHYNIIPAVTKLSVGRYLADGFSFEAAATLNKVSNIGSHSANDLTYFAVDGAVKYDLNNVFGETAWFDPYLAVGGGYTWLDNLGTGTFNGGLGMNFWFSDNFGFNVETKYKHTFESAIVQHFQHSAGFVVKFGGTDTDGDGVFDKEDACPEVFGLAEYNGCPDSDNDGIIDSEDACPNTAGIAAFNGCPDTDEDGITDKEDACPTEKGTKANNGCPDQDGDGVVDKDDNCVDVAGPASNNGCPEITEVEVAKLEELFKTVYFASGKDTFKTETITKLDEAAAIMTKYKTAKFSIEGHTDSTGSSKTNLELSNKRANAVKNYLVSKGVSASNLTAQGYGEDKPIASNRTSKGRAENRRVDVKLVE
jgi:outer membrane protein OmpA-like peptidoglycan-associated protein